VAVDGSRVARAATRIKPYAPELVIACAAIALAWTFVYAVFQRSPTFGLPLEDAYIYLTYAKQFGRLQPFTYFPGGGYSAGSTSVLWPMIIAPFWSFGARGHALVWVSFGLSTALFAATCVGCYRLVREIGGAIPGLAAAGITLAIAPFAWTALAGMEVAFASALLVTMIILLVRCPREGPPPRLLAVWLAATSLSRPEATMIVVGIVGIAVISRLRQRNLRAAAWWLLPLVAPIAWVTANKVFAGNWFPNTGVAKSHFYLPGFDWTYWWDAVTSQSGKMLKALFWDPTSPFVLPRLFSVLWIVGAARVLWWAKAEKRWLVGLLVVASPFALVFAVIASSGAWNFHNYRYIAPAFPLFAITAACALIPPKQLPWLTPRQTLAGWLVATLVLVAGFWRAALPAMREDIQLYAQNVVDLNRQVVTLGQYIHKKLPDASIMFHDAGAISYYGDTRVYDMLGLVTNYQAGIANNGPGSRFEFLESMPVEQRPTHFAYYPAWMGQSEFYGEVVLATPLGPPFSRRRLIGDNDMQLITAVWDHVHTAERPLHPAAGWHLVDRLDIADIANERAHGWRGQLGRRAFADPTAKWSFVHKETGEQGLLIDGGRTIRGKAEDFTITIDPAKPVRLVLRSGGKTSYPWQDTLTAPAKLEIQAAGATAVLDVPPPSGALAEFMVELPASGEAELAVSVRADVPYRAFHWFVLQPD
jgi:hypothetical protein